MTMPQPTGLACARAGATRLRAILGALPVVSTTRPTMMTRAPATRAPAPAHARPLACVKVMSGTPGIGMGILKSASLPPVEADGSEAAAGVEAATPGLVAVTPALP